MRQVGILAAAGIVALETMIERLPEDHDNARLLANGLATIGGISIDPAHVRTNIVIFTVQDWEVRDFLNALSAEGVLALPELRNARQGATVGRPPPEAKLATHRSAPQRRRLVVLAAGTLAVVVFGGYRTAAVHQGDHVDRTLQQLARRRPGLDRARRPSRNCPVHATPTTARPKPSRWS